MNLYYGCFLASAFSHSDYLSDMACVRISRIAERTVSGMTINEAITKNGIGRLGELYKKWLEEKQKAADEHISAYELAEFFEYVDNAIWNGR